MKLRRLVMISRRFWPLVGGAEAIMAGLATEFASRRIEVTLLTARWQPQWPAEIVYHGVPVVRLANPSARFRGTWRYMRAIARWLRRHPDRYDLVYVSMLKHDAYAALGAVPRGRVPVVLRAEGAGRSGDCVWQVEANFGRRIKRRCLRADALVGPSRAIERELQAAGYPRPRIHFLPNGVMVPPPPGNDRRTAARRSLAEANAALECPSDAPVAVYTGRLDEAKGLGELVAAWRQVVARWPNARLWLVGEGPFADDLKRRVEEANLSGRVVLPGVFADVAELLAAADLFVLPSWEEGMSVALLEAMAAALPAVASDVAGNRGLIDAGRNGLLAPVRDPRGLAAAMARLIDQPKLAASLGTAARRDVQQHYSIGRSVDRHLELFERLLGEKGRAKRKREAVAQHPAAAGSGDPRRTASDRASGR